MEIKSVTELIELSKVFVKENKEKQEKKSDLSEKVRKVKCGKMDCNQEFYIDSRFAVNWGVYCPVCLQVYSPIKIEEK